MGEAELGPPGLEPGEQSAIERQILSERDDFPLEQSQDESLKHAFEGPYHRRSTSPTCSSALLSLFCDSERQVVLSDTRHSNKTNYNPVISAKEPSGNAFPGGSF